MAGSCSSINNVGPRKGPDSCLSDLLGCLCYGLLFSNVPRSIASSLSRHPCVHPQPTRCCFSSLFFIISVCFAIKYLSSVPTSLILHLSLSVSQATSVNLAALLSLIELNVLCNLSFLEPLHRSIIVYLGLFITIKMFAFHSSNSFFLCALSKACDLSYNVFFRQSFTGGIFHTGRKSQGHSKKMAFVNTCHCEPR